MRRLAAAAALALCSVAPAGAHPGHGAEAVTIDGPGNRFTPAEVTIAVNENVFWFWEGVVSRNHSVTADPGQAESFDSDPDGPPTGATHPEGDSFSHVFSHPGRFTYHCQVHPGMTGVVNVVKPPAPSPLRLQRLRVANRGDSVQVRFSLSRQSDLVIRVTRRTKAGWRTVETLNREGKRGRNELELDRDDLRPGSYRLRVTAYDFVNQRATEQEAFQLPKHSA